MAERQTEEQLLAEWKQKVSDFHARMYKVKDIEILVMPSASDNVFRVRTASVPRSYQTSNGVIIRELG